MTNYVVITDRKTINRAMGTMLKVLQQGTQMRRKHVGWRGESGDFDIYWNSEIGMWWLYSKEAASSNRHWTCIGTRDPNQGGPLSIDCELNIPFYGINRRVAGAFIQDIQGTVYVVHSGKIGGGGKGIGRSAFIDYYPDGDQWINISWPDGRVTQALMLGAIDSPDLPVTLCDFAKTIHAFKSAVKTGTLRKIINARKQAFKPEFSGKRETYRPSIVNAIAVHGRIVNALHDHMREILPNVIIFNDQRDVVISREDKIVAIFEIKTAIDTTSIYTAIGQLMLHGAVPHPPVQVLVIPDEPTFETQKRLQRLNIIVLTYEIDGHAVRFPLLSKIIKHFISASPCSA